MDYIPYRLENIFTGVEKPAPVKNTSYAFAFWKRCLYHRLCSIIEFDLPENWLRAKDFFEACLFARGYVGVFNSVDYGIAFQPGTVSGYDFYYQPTRFLVANPVMKESGDFKIGETCELIKLTNDFRGVMDIINYYAEKLATLDGAVNMAIINSKFAYVFGAHNKAAAQAVKMIFDKINAGDPTVIYDAKITEGLGDTEPFEFIERSSLKNSYITTDLLRDFQTILNSFDNEIGIPTLGAGEKKERMITDEAEAKQADASARVTLWDECLKNSIERVNNMFDLNISYTFRFLEQMKEEEQKEGGAEEWALQSLPWKG
ncbi:MAG: hypothetical protein J6Q39_06990 [Bacteroidales bacterium]|nr:hypothetical protein [Bacteroidales bacterium]